MAIPQLTHAGLFTMQVEVLADFYKNVLRLVETDRGLLARMNDTPIVFLSGSEDSHHQLVIAESDHSSHVQQLSFKVNDLEDLRAANDRAVQYGAKGIRTWDHGNAWSVYFFDPDDNLVEVYMDTIFHVAQPHGRTIDFNMTDEEILQYTFQAIKDDPTFCYMEEWRESLRDKLKGR